MKISVIARPRACKEEVVAVDAKNYKVSVKEMPVGGAANEAVCRALAEYFDVPPSCVSVVSGHTAKKKIVEIAGI